MKAEILVALMGFSVIGLMLHWHFKSLRLRRIRLNHQEDDVQQEIQSLTKDVSFYEERKKSLTHRAEQRKQLARVAHQLGSLLDPQEIQKKLITAAQTLFPQHPVTLSYGQSHNAVDTHVIGKRQSFFAAENMAVPVFAQRQVVGILRIDGFDHAFGRDELRTLENLANLASLAFDNSLLFSQVQQTALRDGLTGLITHRALQDQLETQILEASRYHQPVSVILADVDHFKKVNDTYGHQAGDQILQGFAHILVRHVRDIDVVARYGGEEFVILLLQTGCADAVRIAEAIREDLQAQSFVAGRHVIQITGSFGVATFPEDATSAQQLLREADQRLYKCKRGGRNQVKGA